MPIAPSSSGTIVPSTTTALRPLASRACEATLGHRPTPDPTATRLWSACSDSSPIALSSPSSFRGLCALRGSPPPLFDHEEHQRHESEPRNPGPSRGFRPGGPSENSPARERWVPPPHEHPVPAGGAASRCLTNRTATPQPGRIPHARFAQDAKTPRRAWKDIRSSSLPPFRFFAWDPLASITGGRQQDAQLVATTAMRLFQASGSNPGLSSFLGQPFYALGVSTPLA
jgi:hypothetical protein